MYFLQVEDHDTVVEYSKHFTTDMFFIFQLLPYHYYFHASLAFMYLEVLLS